MNFYELFGMVSFWLTMGVTAVVIIVAIAKWSDDWNTWRTDRNLEEARMRSRIGDLENTVDSLKWKFMQMEGGRAATHRATGGESAGVEQPAADAPDDPQRDSAADKRHSGMGSQVRGLWPGVYNPESGHIHYRYDEG